MNLFVVSLLLAGFLVALVAVVLGFRFFAHQTGRRKWLWGWIGAVVGYHILFWDLIPTAFLYHQYRARHEWQRVDVAALEVAKESAMPSPAASAIGLSPRREIPSGHRYAVVENVARFHVVEPLALSLVRIEDRLVDTVTGQELVVRSFIQSGRCADRLHYRFWIKRCAVPPYSLEAMQEDISEAAARNGRNRYRTSESNPLP